MRLSNSLIHVRLFTLQWHKGCWSTAASSGEFVLLHNMLNLKSKTTVPNPSKKQEFYFTIILLYIFFQIIKTYIFVNINIFKKSCHLCAVLHTSRTEKNQNINMNFHLIQRNLFKERSWFMSSSNHVSSIMHFQTDGTPEMPNPNNMNLIFSHGHRLNFSV